jgi:hypothetical protein
MQLSKRGDCGAQPAHAMVLMSFFRPFKLASALPTMCRAMSR